MDSHIVLIGSEIAEFLGALQKTRIYERNRDNTKYSALCCDL